MLRDLWPIFGRAFFSSLSAIGESIGSLGFSSAIVCVAAIWVWLQKGWAKFTEHVVRKILQTLAITLLLFAFVFSYHLGSERKAAEVAASPVPTRQEPLKEPFVEPKNSLRRRTVQLADDLDAFLAGRSPRRPTDQKEGALYDQETIELYLSLYKSRTVGILQELQAKGLDVGLLAAPGAAQSRFLMREETKELRDLAHRLDEKGNPEHF